MEQTKYVIDEKKTVRAFKKLRRKQTFKRRFSVACKWVSDNKEVVILLGPAVIGLAAAVVKGGISLVKAGVKHINIQTEKKVKDCYCYDRSLGHYWALRRELSNREWIEIDKRKKNGERMADILNDLHVLK